jgi:hypothetical protein
MFVFKKVLINLSVVAMLAVVCQPLKETSQQNWTHFVRIGGHGLSLERVPKIIQSATETHVFGIETDNDIPGRYESFLDPAEKLHAIAEMAKQAHAVNNYSFVYIAGLECITANADKSEHSFFKDHPDWVQRKITGEPAIFGGGTAFWIDEGDEDVWISPYAPEWRKIYMERVRQIAATGIDGVYVDIPYWMTHFDGWEDSWASFDDYTVAAFKQQTGLDAKKDVKLGDFNDTHFRTWVDFRIQTITEFMKEIDQNVKAANPKCMTIAEIYPGIEEDAVRVGADVYELYPVVDAIAHEYSAGGYTAAARDPLDWLLFMAGMYSFRAFAQDKASWMLCYSWDEEKNMMPQEPMKNLALSHVVTGTNTWDAQGHVMSGSNDFATRTEIFQWIADNEKLIYSPRQPISPVGIYFSPKTRNYFTEEFVDSYRGFMMWLMNSRLEFQIVTPRTLEAFDGSVLILPDVKCISQHEVDVLKNLTANGLRLWITGETGKFDDERRSQPMNPLQAMIESAGHLYNSDCPGKTYLKLVRKDYDECAFRNREDDKAFIKFGNFLNGQLFEKLEYRPAVRVTTSSFVHCYITSVNDKPCVFIANLTGLKRDENAVQTPAKGIKIQFPATHAGQIHFLPYLSQPQVIPADYQDGHIQCTLPDVNKGAIVWCE